MICVGMVYFTFVFVFAFCLLLLTCVSEAFVGWNGRERMVDTPEWSGVEQ